MNPQIENNAILEKLEEQYRAFKDFKDPLKPSAKKFINKEPEIYEQIKSFYDTLNVKEQFQELIQNKDNPTVGEILNSVLDTVTEISIEQFESNPSILESLEKLSIKDIQILPKSIVKSFYTIRWGLKNKVLIGSTSENKEFIQNLYTLDQETGEMTPLKTQFLALQKLQKLQKNSMFSMMIMDSKENPLDKNGNPLDKEKKYILNNFHVNLSNKRKKFSHLAASLVIYAKDLTLLTDENLQKAHLSKKDGNREKEIKDLVQLDNIQKSLDAKITQFNTVISQQEAKIQELIEQLENIQIQKNQEIDELHSRIRYIIEMNRRSLFQQEAVVFNKIISRVSEDHWDEVEDDDGLIPFPYAIYQRLEFNCNYHIDQDIVYNMIALLRTNKICVFAGTCGSGKSSFIEKFGEVCGAAVTVIPVKSNWHSPEDMIGYYDSQKGHFIPATDFVKALKNAKLERERLHIIVLDEMNLAHVEYYFADILSLSELTDPEKRKIQLYSYCDIQEDPNSPQDNTTIRVEKLEIPPNVRFIGTINIDETTHYLSPKVLDRVHVVRFDSPSEFPENGEFKAYNNNDKYINYSKYFGTVEKPLEGSILSPYKTILAVINDILRDYKKEFGYRVMAQFNDYMAICSELNMDLDTAFENFICQKILPRLTIYNGEKMITALSESLPVDKYKKVTGILDQIKEKAEAANNNYYSYWDI